jgi:tetratricopeptide (TPR) repeat protein
MSTRSSISRNKKFSNNIRKSESTDLKGRGTSVPRRWQVRSEVKSERKTALATPDSISWADQDAWLRQKALLKAQMGEHEAAIALFTSLITRNPESASDYNNRGLAHFQSGQPVAALADFNQAIDLNPRLDSAYNNRANYHAAEGLFLEAILDYDIALDLNPGNVRAWVNQGITFRDLGIFERAVESFDLALHLGKLQGHVYAERGRTYHLWGDWNCAVADYQRAIAYLAESDNSLSAKVLTQVESWMQELFSSLTF